MFGGRGGVRWGKEYTSSRGRKGGGERTDIAAILTRNSTMHLHYKYKYPYFSKDGIET